MGPAVRDRLYGEIELPGIAQELARECPMLLRLREIRLPNVPLLTFPSYAGASRYEHSVGVAHLAWWWARRNRLAPPDAEALTLAALYHDAATPAFSHLFEEQLAAAGFDHESELAHTVATAGSVPGHRYAQIFLGRSARLRDEVETHSRSSTRLSIDGLYDLMTGADPLGVIVHGDIDLDNIDNTVRAATAMGLDDAHLLKPLEIAAALEWDGKQVVLSATADGPIRSWRGARRAVYDNLLSSKTEFLAQTAVKWAIDLCSLDDDHGVLRSPRAWVMTEPELVFGHLRLVEESRRLIDDLRLGRLPEFVACAWHGDLRRFLRGGSSAVNAFADRVTKALEVTCYANFYIDKRERSICLPSRVGLWTAPSQDIAPDHTGPPCPGVVGVVCPRGVRDRLDGQAICDVVGQEVTAALGAPPDHVGLDWGLPHGSSPAAVQPSLL